MKIQLETVTSQINQSFSVMYNPRLSDLFFWHAHPEYELVFIEAASGTRHVGEHISNFSGNDMVLIGSNIPHLNFDYGIKSDYRQVVVHFKKEFVEQHFIHASEMVSIHTMFEKSKCGIAFNHIDQNEIGQRLFNLESLGPFQQYLHLIEILQELSLLNNIELLHSQPYNSQITNKEHQRIQRIYSFVDSNYHRKIELQEVAQLSHMTREAFCRYFKKMTKYTFVEFLNRYRISHSKRYLMTGESVSNACYQSGFESLSYFNRVFKKVSGENPKEFRSRYL